MIVAQASGNEAMFYLAAICDGCGRQQSWAALVWYHLDAERCERRLRGRIAREGTAIVEERREGVLALAIIDLATQED